jgi:hypothetical protein
MFYTYLWLREDGTPYYVGKGKGDRAFISDGHNIHRPKTSDRIIVQDFESEEDAFEAEKFLISYYGRTDLGTGCLRNLTDGGEGTSGYKHSEEGLKRLCGKTPWNKGMKGKYKCARFSEETRKRMSESRKGTHPTEETKKKISSTLRRLGLQPSKEAVRKAHEKRWGYVRSA